MPNESIQARALVIIVAVFLALVVVHVRWGRDDPDADADQAGPRLSHVQVAEEEPAQAVDVDSPLSGTELSELMDGRVRLLVQGEPNERRATAIQLAFMAGDVREQQGLLQLGTARRKALEEALLKGLLDDDPTVADKCRGALLSLWRLADSSAARRQVHRGISALEAGDWDLALRSLNDVEKLTARIPPELHRLKAEVYLATGLPRQAVDECSLALQAEPHQFMAHYALAKACLRLDEVDKAREFIEIALAICPRLPEAQRLRAEMPDAPAE